MSVEVFTGHEWELKGDEAQPDGDATFFLNIPKAAIAPATVGTPLVANVVRVRARQRIIIYEGQPGEGKFDVAVQELVDGLPDDLLLVLPKAFVPPHVATDVQLVRDADEEGWDLSFTTEPV